MHRAVVFLALFATSLAIRPANAQPSSFLPLDHPAYRLIGQLQVRGYLLELHPTALPYARQAVHDALAVADAVTPLESALLQRLRGLIGPEGEGDRVLTVDGGTGLRTTSNGRYDPIRVRDGGRPVFPWVTLGMQLTDGVLIARAAGRFDMYYEFDPDAIDATNRIYVRNEETYVGVMSRRVDFLLGRYGVHWGPNGGPATMLSGNARSFDGLHLRFGNDRLALRSVVGELDSSTGDGRFTGIAGDDSVATGSDRRWLSVHRLDWRIGQRVVLYAMEGTLYSGPGTGFSLKYLNPTLMHGFAVDNRPKNDENNGQLAVGFWARPGLWTIDGQLMLDDLDIHFGREPAAIAATAGVQRPAGPFNVMARATVIASRTYNTFQPEGRWMYLGRGLASQYSDYVALEAGATWFAEAYVPGLTVSPYALLVHQGEQDYHLPRGDDDYPWVLTGTLERTVRMGARLDWMPLPFAYATVDAGWNRVTNRHHIAGNSLTRFVVTGEFGLRFVWHNTAP